MAEVTRPEQRPQIGVIEPEVFRIEPPEEELWTDESGTDYTGWYCVRTNPWPCPADGCVFVAHFLTAAHLVILWPEADDPNLLRQLEGTRDQLQHRFDALAEELRGYWDEWDSLAHEATADERKPVRDKMVGLLNRRSYIRNLVRDVNEVLED